MNKKQLQSSLILSLTAFIWGFAFVAQRAGMDYLEPFSFNAVRFLFGSASLLPVIYFFQHTKKVAIASGKVEASSPEATAKVRKDTLKAGILCGIVLFSGSALQQIGLQYTDAGKAGFITALYMVLVPIFSIVLKKKVGLNAWLSVAIAAIGLYFLCIPVGSGSFAMAKGDLIVLIGALFWATHILTIDHFIDRINAVIMSSIQFITVSIISFIVAFIFESDTFTLAGVSGAMVPLLFTGLLSSGVAYTLQIIGQKNAEPTVASIILSTESVFAVIGGVLILHEVLSMREGLGCLLVFAAVILSQLPFPMKKKEAA